MKDFLRSRRFSLAVVGFIASLLVGPLVGIPLTNFLLRDAAFPDVLIGLVYIPIFILATVSIFIFIGYQLGKRIDFPQGKKLEPERFKKRMIYPSVFLIFIAGFIAIVLQQHGIYSKSIICRADFPPYEVKCPVGSYCQGISLGEECRAYFSPIFEGITTIMERFSRINILDNKNFPKEDQLLRPNQSDGFPSQEAQESSEVTAVKSLVSKFEQYIQDRNVNDLMSLFTFPETKEEVASYRNLIGLDPDVGSPRLFNNVTSNFIVINWKIARRESPDNKELITKDGNKYFVDVEETRKSWCNSDPCAGTYSFEKRNIYIFEIISVNSQWMVDKYYFMNQRNVSGGPKYEALNF